MKESRSEFAGPPPRMDASASGLAPQLAGQLPDDPGFLWRAIEQMRGAGPEAAIVGEALASWLAGSSPAAAPPVDLSPLADWLDGMAASSGSARCARAAAILRPRPPGRPTINDAPRLAEIAAILEHGEAPSVDAASRLVAASRGGGHSFDAESRRLARKYRAQQSQQLSHKTTAYLNETLCSVSSVKASSRNKEDEAMFFSDIKTGKAVASADKAKTIFDVSPEYARVSAKLQALCAREDEILAELNSIRVQVNEQAARSSSPPPENYFRRRRQKAKAATIVKTTEAAAKLLGDLAPEPKIIPAPEEKLDATATRINDLADELDITREAIAAIRDIPPGETLSLWSRAHLAASRAYCEHVAPEYAVVAKNYIEAAIALGNAHLALEDFSKSRLTQTLTASLRPLAQTLPIGDPRDRSAPVRLLLDWAVEIGRLNPKDIPSDWSRPAP